MKKLKNQPTNASPNRAPDLRLTENGLVNDIYEEKDGTVYAHRHDGGQTKAILEFNKKMRNSGLATGGRETGQCPLSIPPDHYHHVLPVTHPELFVDDPKLRLIAWKQFVNHPDCEPYKLQHKNTKYFGGVTNELRPTKDAD